MKKIAICPQCKTKVTIEGELNQKIPIECKTCGKKGIIVFRKPPVQSQPPTLKKTQIKEPPKSPIKKPQNITTKTSKPKKTSLFKKKETQSKPEPKPINEKKPIEPPASKKPQFTTKPTPTSPHNTKSLSFFHKNKTKKNTQKQKSLKKKQPIKQTKQTTAPKEQETLKKPKKKLFTKKEKQTKKILEIKNTQKILGTKTKIDQSETITTTQKNTTRSLLKKKAKAGQSSTTTTETKQTQKTKQKPLNLKELDFYPVHEPFAYIKILSDTVTLDKYYKVIEPQLTQQEQTDLDNIENKLIKSLHIHLEEIEEDTIDSFLISEINKIIGSYNLKINDITKRKFLYYIKRDFIGYGKIDALMRDPNIEDISCDGSEVPVFLYHRIYNSLKSNVLFTDEKELSAYVVRLSQKCGKHISIAEPMLDATMPDGSRIQMTLSKAVTAKGSTFTIRKFRSDPITPTDLINYNTMSAEMVAYMWMAVENGINALISGGTASGKTSALNALALFIPRESKIVSIEETREINLPHPNWIPGVSRSGLGEVVNEKMVGEIGLFDLMKAALRQRPEYIIVGEIRGQEAYVLFQAMATGHTTYSTVHADSPKSLIHRLEGKPINIPRMMLQSLDIVVIQASVHMDGKNVRRSRQIVEIIDIDSLSKEILTNEVFHWDPVADKHIYSGKSYILERIRSQYDMDMQGLSDEFRRRVRILEWMKKNNIRVFKDVATIISLYKDNPDEIMSRIENDEKKVEEVSPPNYDEKEELMVAPKQKKVMGKLVKKKLWKR